MFMKPMEDYGLDYVSGGFQQEALAAAKPEKRGVVCCNFEPERARGGVYNGYAFKLL